MSASCLLPLFFPQVGIDADVVLPLVLAQVEDLKGPVVFPGGLELALHADQAFAGGVDGEFAEIGGDPFAAQFFRHRRRGAGAAEEVGDEVAFVGRGLDDAFDECFWFLGGIVSRSSESCECTWVDIVQTIPQQHPGYFVKITLFPWHLPFVEQ